MLDSDAQSTLTDLRWHWDDAYKIDCRDGVWLAVPLTDPFVTISRGQLRRAARGTPAGLRTASRTAAGRQQQYIAGKQDHFTVPGVPAVQQPPQQRPS